jgi:phosphoglycerate dehydrogenase-like enzyme
MIRVAALDDYQGVALKKADWSKLPPDTDVRSFTDHIDDADALVARLEPFDVIIGMRERTPFPRSLVERLPNLKLLITTGARNASFDLAALKERGVTVCATGSLGTPTAELAWGLIIGLMRHIAEEDANVRAGGWQRTIGPTLAGRTLGCLGLGNLGSQVAKVGKAFGMDVIAWSQNLTAERAAEVGARLVSKDELFSQADVITIHLVLGDRTRGLVGAPELALMKPTSYLVNTSRGPIVDETALIDALRSKRIAGAALDVFNVEPLPAGHALRSLPNTLITPHLGYVTDEAYDIFYQDAVEDILAWLADSPVRQIGL